MDRLEAETKTARRGPGIRLAQGLTRLAAQVHEHHEVQVLIPLTFLPCREGAAPSLVDRAPIVRHVYGVRVAFPKDVDDQPASTGRQTGTLDLRCLSKRVVGVLSEFQKNARLVIAVAPHLLLNAVPEEVVGFGRFDLLCQFVERLLSVLSRRLGPDLVQPILCPHRLLQLA